jgi:phosphoglycolate phosphatase
VPAAASLGDDVEVAVAGPFLFDLDGCLVDSTPVIAACIDHALTTVADLPALGVDALRFAVGPPLLTTFEQLLGDRGGDAALVARCVDAYRHRYALVAHAQTVVIPGVPAALDALAEHGSLAVVTSKPHPIAEPLLRALGLRERFAAVHGPAADHAVEPKATTLARALDALGVADARSTAMIGDRSHDIVAGRAHGTRTVGVTWGAGARAELEAAGADVVVDDPAELLGALRPGAPERGGRAPGG